MRVILALACAVLIAAAAGCGGSSGDTPTNAASTTRGRTSTDPTAALTLAVRRALRANYQLSGYVLWHNAVPLTARRSTRGPALAALRTAATQRRKSGIRIRPITGHLAIVSVSLDPSFTTATAVTVASGHVRPYEGGKREPREISVHERARIELHRLDRSNRFVVWQVTVLR
jgi:hypothetical protein